MVEPTRLQHEEQLVVGVAQALEVVDRLGGALLQHRELPAVFRSALGDEMYLIRHQELSDMREAVRFIQARS